MTRHSHLRRIDTAPPWSASPRDFSPAVFASSLAAEDMVLTDLILKAQLPIGDLLARNRPPASGNAGRAGRR